jgi:hypothetical protein
MPHAVATLSRVQHDPVVLLHTSPPEQSAQIPLVPHSLSEVPGWQVPPAGAEQQPPLQSCAEEQLVVQIPLAVSQASPVGQSVSAVHPHLPLGRHAVPMELPTQDVHAKPVDPHSAWAVPGAQRPALQQPPLQGWLEEHVVVHACVVTSHA